VLVLATFGLVASRSSGFALTKLDLHDTGIWISNDAQSDGGYYGRVNKAALGLDATPGPPGTRLPKYELDIIQDGHLVAGWDKTNAKLTAINTATAQNVVDDAVDLKPGSLLQMRGGTLAVLDRTGKLWATRYSAEDSVLDVRGIDSTLKPIADLDLKKEFGEGTISLAVATNGMIYAASVAGQLIQIPLTASGAFDKPVSTPLGGSFEAIQIAAVGASVVLYDPVSGRVQLPSGKSATVKADPAGKLQESGPTAAGVLVATSSDLTRITLENGDLNRVDGSGDGAPARPVRLAGCDFAAWAGVGRYVRACEGSSIVADQVKREGGLSRPVFRINNGLILLNDQADGWAFDFDTKGNLANWADVRPKSSAEEAKKSEQVTRDEAKPKAKDDNLKARPDRTTVLHVLDNDTDSAHGILMIKGVSGVADNVKVEVAPDAQTLKIVMPQGLASTVFRYKISNGSNESEGQVTVTNAGTGNTPPKYLAGSTVEYTTPSFGNLSIPVVGNWRDEEGDPVAVVSAADDQGQVVPVTADGRIEFTAGRMDTPTVKKIIYQVTDGIDAKPVEGAVNVNVLADNDSKSVPPVVQPDTAQGEVGKPVTIWPLANDVPGADPRNPQARLVLGADVPQKTDLAIVTDTKGGKVEVTGSKVGSYFLDYQAGYGSSALAKGTIRVDIGAAGASASPVAMPDQAAVHGQGAVMVDVLANDYDPAGGMLTVQAASAADATQLEVAVIGGRWLRILPSVDTFAANPQVVHYTVSNGSQNTTGDVMVTQLPGVSEDQPIVRDDFAVVRDNDSVLIGVLDNDTSLSGAPLTLATNIQGIDSAGQLKVINPAKAANENQGDIGTAFVHNGRIRYVAPLKVEASQQVQIEYVAVTASGNTGVGHVTVTLNPQPATTDVDQAPVPQTVEMRLVSGSRVAIPIPTTGADPDGDTVTVTGITSAPSLGRVVGFSPASITYEAYPTAGLVGTDSFSYEVTDRYGKKGQATVRVAVVAPGQTQPPVAINDALTARPGAKVQLNVVANDLVSRDDSVVIAPLETLNQPMPAGVSLAGKKGPLVATAPQADAQPLVVLYALKGNGGTGPSASATIVAKDGYKNPPTVLDQTAVIDGKNATADLLSGAWDNDGDVAALKSKVLTSVQGLVLDGSKVTVPLSDRAQVIPFQVTDADGASNAGVVFVPAAGAGAPMLKPGGLIELGQNSTVTLNLADYVTSPRGKVVKLASGTVTSTPSANLSAEVVDADKFKLTSKNDYVGPGAVVVEVMDANSLTEPDVLKATVSIPVQVGPKTPVLRCPSDAQLLVQGGEAKELDITTLCHVWSPNPDDLTKIAYTATWSKAPTDVSVKADGGTVTLQAGANAVGEQTGSVTIGVSGSPAKTAEIAVTVKEAAKPTMQSQTINDVKQGTAVNVQLGLKSPLLKPEPTIMEIKQVSGPHASFTNTGTTMTFTPDANVSGTIVFSVTASDLADKTRTNRFVTRNVTLVVYGKPDAPGAPQPGNTVQSRSVSLTWAAPKSNGAPIDQYKVVCDNGMSWTFQSTSGNVTGLKNGDPVKFQVQAHNKADWGPLGPWSASVTPNEAPGAVTGVTASDPQDASLMLSWNKAMNGGSDVTFTHISWAGGDLKLGGSPVQQKITGLNNNTKYTFTVWVENAYKPGPNATGTGQSSGKPLNLAVSAPVPATSVGASTPVTIKWTQVDPNGPGPATYSVARSDGKQICSKVTATQCTDDTVVFDGTTYTYTVTAVNATGEPHSVTASSPPWKATGTPDKWSAWQAAATGDNGTVRLTFTVPPARGKTSTVTLLQNGAAKTTWTAPTGGGADTKDVTGLSNGTTYSFVLKVCNDSDICSTSNALSATPFGPLTAPTLTVNQSGRTISITANGNGNGANATLTVTSSTGKTFTPSTGSAGLTVSGSETLAWSQQATYSVRLTSSSTQPSRPSPLDGASKTVTAPPPPPPSVSVTQTGVSGQNVTFRVDANGNGVDNTTVSVTGCSSGSGNVGAGAWSGNYTCSGWSTTHTLNATVTSSGGSSSANASGTTGAQPPSQTVSISWGAKCGSTCLSGSTMINLTTTGFTGSYSCTMYERSASGALKVVTASSGFTNTVTYTNNLTNNTDFFGVPNGLWPENVIKCGNVYSNGIK